MANEYFSVVSGSFLSRPNIDPATKVILINLNGRAGIPGWTCSPSSIANETGIPINTVCRRFKRLEAMGVISFGGYVCKGATRFKQYTIRLDVLAAVMEKAAGFRMKAAPFKMKAAAFKLTTRSKIQKQDGRSNIQKEDTSNQGIIKGTSEPAPHSQKWLELKKVEVEQKKVAEESEQTLRQWKKEIELDNYADNLGRRYVGDMSDEEIEKFRDL